MGNPGTKQWKCRTSRDRAQNAAKILPTIAVQSRISKTTIIHADRAVGRTGQWWRTQPGNALLQWSPNIWRMDRSSGNSIGPEGMADGFNCGRAMGATLSIMGSNGVGSKKTAAIQAHPRVRSRISHLSHMTARTFSILKATV
jgi:hypothetical protein